VCIRQLFQDTGDDGGRKSKQPGGLFARQRQSLHFREFAVNPIHESVASIHVAAFSANCGGQVSRSWNQGDVQESLPTRFVWLSSAHAPSDIQLSDSCNDWIVPIVPNLAGRRCSIQNTRSSPRRIVVRLTNTLAAVGASAPPALQHPGTGQEIIVFPCFNQDQRMDRADFVNLAARVRQNTVQEKLSGLWFDHLVSRRTLAHV
jgi:hypothetical protein